MNQFLFRLSLDHHASFFFSKISNMVVFLKSEFKFTTF